MGRVINLWLGKYQNKAINKAIDFLQELYYIACKCVSIVTTCGKYTILYTRLLGN